MVKKIIYQTLVIILPYLFIVLWGYMEAYIMFLTLLFLIYSLVINVERQKIIYLWVLVPVSVFIFYNMSNGFEITRIQNPLLWKNFSLYFVLLMLAGYLTGFFISKCKKKIVYSLTFLIAITQMIHLLGNIAFMEFSFVTAGIIFLVAPYIAWRYVSQKLYIPLILIAPYILISLDGWITGTIMYAYFFAPLFGIAIFYMALLLKSKRVVQIVLISVYTIFLIYGWYKGVDDSNAWRYARKAKLPQETYAEYIFYDVAEQAITPMMHEGKIVVLDFWTTSCGICFSEFPEFEKVYQKYNHRDDIVFYAVNLPIKRDTKESIMKAIETHVNYSFPVLLAEEGSDYWTQFKIGGVPHLMIIEKRGNVYYNGGAYYEKKSAYYIENMIDNLLK